MILLCFHDIIIHDQQQTREKIFLFFLFVKSIFADNYCKVMDGEQHLKLETSKLKQIQFRIQEINKISHFDSAAGGLYHMVQSASRSKKSTFSFLKNFLEQ